jgi:membrane fusion protein, copper/silver efflux system
MRRFRGFMLLAVGVAVGIAGMHLHARYAPELSQLASFWETAAPTGEREVLYYRDPGGAPYWSATPKMDAQGRDYLPVYADEEDVAFGPKQEEPPSETESGERKILYYRNPMGLPDISPVPKKDSMGMDYIPVYEDDAGDDDGTITVSPVKVQRSGVRTERVNSRRIQRAIRAVGTVDHDESLLTSVTMRSEGFIEELFVDKTGQHVREGEALFRVYSPQIQQAQTDFIVAMRTHGRKTGRDADKALAGAIQRLKNLDVPDSRIEELRRTGENPRMLDWPAPATGDVIDKKVIKGQRVMPGDELYRIADHSRVWVIADVAEAEISALKAGTRATVMLRSDPSAPLEGEVTLIYPVLSGETRTVPVRIEIDNPELRLKPNMYADVVFHLGDEEAQVAAVPTNAVIDSGLRRSVLVAKGEGRFEPREVKLGRSGDGYVEVLEGLAEGEEVVTSANFLIDAESNLRAALRAFTDAEPQP